MSDPAQFHLIVLDVAGMEIRRLCISLTLSNIRRNLIGFIESDPVRLVPGGNRKTITGDCFGFHLQMKVGIYPIQY